ncbi:replication protein A, subunit RPA32 [Trichodelitschia bisporula]|uniref:Replication protein A, subunit RPA32 n=1 Tax=Trichodelitschia bisporula TaxID=703511 RepID=A0A6G1HZ39_9PEZI|nr:replication protein A, subunit RPA32 [Trichodelitschia bisporula]
MDYGNYGNQYGSTSFGGQVGGMGGGMGGGGFVASQNSPSGGGRNYENSSLRPVTIKQLLDAQMADGSEEFTIDSRAIDQITFVGQVSNISAQSVRITYRLDDGTGIIEVKVFSPTEGDHVTSRPNVEENSYVRVIGKLKSFQNKRHVGAHIIRPVTDFNEISYHLLEAATVHLYFKHGPPGAKDTSGSAGNMSGVQQGGVATGGAGGGVSLGADGLPPGLSAAARKVYHTLSNTPQSNEGLHLQDIANKLHMDAAQVGRAGDELLEMGLIYTTVDDTTWAILSRDTLF